MINNVGVPGVIMLLFCIAFLGTILFVFSLIFRGNRSTQKELLSKIDQMQRQIDQLKKEGK